MKLNEKLTELRKAKGLTQQEIAEALNVSRQAVSRWEVGTAAPSLDNLVFLSRLYGVPLDDFIQEEPGEPAEVPTDALAEVPADTPAAVSAKTGRSYATPVCAFLAVLILGVGILIGGSMQSKLESDEQGLTDTTEGSDVSFFDTANDQITIFTPEGRYTYSVPSGKTSAEIENRFLRDEDLQKIEDQIAAEQEEVKKNAPPRAKLSDEDARELAERYDPNAMTREHYDSFLETLADKGVLTREEIGYIGYKGITVVDPDRLNGAVVIPMNDPTDQASRNLLWGDYSTGSPISGFLFRNLDDSFDVLAWANMMNTFYNNDTDSWQGYYGAMYDVLDRMSSAREQMK